jgi:hypothetical protein
MASSNAAQVKVRSTAGGESRPDIFDRMEAGRERLRFLTTQLRQSRDGAPDRRRLFDMLCDAVEAHNVAAEQSLYAELLARTEDQQPARRAVDAHDAAALLIGELSDMEMVGDAWQAGVGRLAEHLEDHFRAEECETLPLAKTLLDGEQVARLGDKYERTRRQWIEVFGRLPAAPQPLPVERSHPVEPAGGDAGLRGRGRAATWLERLRRPLRAAEPSRSATAG